MSAITAPHERISLKEVAGNEGAAWRQLNAAFADAAEGYDSAYFTEGAQVIARYVNGEKIFTGTLGALLW